MKTSCFLYAAVLAVGIAVLGLPTQVRGSRSTILDRAGAQQN
jgi:hypothetical protein